MDVVEDPLTPGEITTLLNTFIQGEAATLNQSELPSRETLFCDGMPVIGSPMDKAAFDLLSQLVVRLGKRFQEGDRPKPSSHANATAVTFVPATPEKPAKAITRPTPRLPVPRIYVSDQESNKKSVKGKKEEFNDSFDELVEHKDKDLGYKYKAAPKRTRRERASLQGHECHDCKAFYNASDLSAAQRKDLLQKCSRHRSKFPQVNDSPKNIWKVGDLSDDSDKTVMEHSPLKTRKYRREKRREMEALAQIKKVQ